MVKSTDKVGDNSYNDFANKVLNVDSNGEAITSDNPMPVALPGFELPSYDTINVTYPTAEKEVYSYVKSGVNVGTITVTYTDSTKSILLKVEKS